MQEEKKSPIKKTIVIFLIVLIVASIGVYFLFFNNEIDLDPLEDLEYVNREFGYGFNPPENWTKTTMWSMSLTFNCENVEFKPNYSNSATFPRYVMNVSLKICAPESCNNGNMEDFVNYLTESCSNESFTANYTVIHGERKLNGMDAYEFIISNATTKYKIIFTECNSKVFSIEYDAPIDLYDKYDEVVEQSINTLVIA